MRMRDVTGMIANLGRGDNERVNRFGSGMLNLIGDANDPSVATMKQAMEAGQILIELPLTDGNSVVVPVQPRSPSFQHFVAKCLEKFPDPATPSGPRVTNSGPEATTDRPSSGGMSTTVPLTSAPAAQPTVPDPTVQQPGFRVSRGDVATRSSGASSMPVYRDDLLGEYLNDGHLYSIRLANAKPIAVYEYDKTTQDLTATTLYTGPSPHVIAGGADAQKRADAVLKKYLATHPDLPGASGLSEIRAR
jgi:hypothetical protein